MKKVTTTLCKKHVASSFLKGFASINLFGGSLKSKANQFKKHDISRCFSEVTIYLNHSTKLFSDKYVSK